jgi:LmbE family N-acetylglucosaminyl deacetylase
MNEQGGTTRLEANTGQDPAWSGAYPTRPITLLGVWAHPDDESYLSAALMSRVVNAGGRVVLATATRGERGGSGDDPKQLAVLRELELRAAMSSVGVDDVRLLGHADGQCSSVDTEQATRSIIALIEDVHPDVVVSFGPDGITHHPDHVAVSNWTTAAARAVGHEGLLYATMTDDFVRRHDALHSSIGLWIGDEPRTVAEADLALHVVPTPREQELKRRALRAHASQTTVLIDLVGADVFDSWWVDEYFRRPTVDESAAAPSWTAAPWLVR